MKIVTFYSYKGGVGRTLALANVGRIMARDGLRLLLVDFDLEAPGLSILGSLGADASRKGIVDYIHQLRASDADVVDTTPFCHEINGQPNLFLMPVGALDAEYGGRFAALPFAHFYAEERGQQKLKRLFAELAQRLRLEYVLIDSRTGYSDYGWACLVGLADIVVLLTGLNDQNLQGTRGVLEALEDQRKPLEDIILVAAPVPEGDEELKDARFAKAAELFRGRAFDLELPHNLRLCLREDLDFHRWVHSALSRAYHRLTREVRQRNPDDPRTKLNIAREAFVTGDYSDTEIFRDAAAANPQEPAAQALLGRVLQATQQFDEAIAAFHKAAGLAEDESECGRYVVMRDVAHASHLDRLEEIDDPTRLAKAVDAALADIQAESPPDSNDPHILTGSARALNSIASTLWYLERRAEAEDLWRTAAGRLRQAVALDADSHTARSALATTLRDLADCAWHTGDAESAEQLCREAIGLREEGVTRETRTVSDVRGLGGALGTLGKILGATGRDQQARNTWGKALGYLDQADAMEPGCGAYDRACVLALGGDAGAALAALRTAIEKDPSLRIAARADSDLRALRSDPQFRALVARKASDA